MANIIPDYIGDVYIVLDAENIKFLLRLPYNNRIVIVFLPI